MRAYQLSRRAFFERWAAALFFTGGQAGGGFEEAVKVQEMLMPRLRRPST